MDLMARDILDAVLGKYGIAVETVRSTCSAIQNRRLHCFLEACKREFKEKEDLSGKLEVSFSTMFESDFAKRKAYDFMRRAVDSTSKIGLFALGRLYIRCNMRGVGYLTRRENLLFKAYAGLDDYDAKVLLKVYELKKKSDGSLQSRKLNSEEQPSGGVLQMSTSEWSEGTKDHFNGYNIQNSNELRDIMESFSQIRVFSSTAGLMGTYEGNLFRLLENEITMQFIFDLIWAANLSGETY